MGPWLGFVILGCGFALGWVAAETNFQNAIDTCDTEVLRCQIQSNEDREAYFREAAECNK